MSNGDRLWLVVAVVSWPAWVGYFRHYQDPWVWSLLNGTVFALLWPFSLLALLIRRMGYRS